MNSPKQYISSSLAVQWLGLYSFTAEGLGSIRSLIGEHPPSCMMVWPKKKRIWYISLKGFPCSSACKESSCNAANTIWHTGFGRSAGERIGYPLQYSWASQVAQLVRNSPAMPEIWVQSLDWEDPLEKGMATHSSILAWRIPWIVQSWGCKGSDMTERLPLSLKFYM